jgi:hypothetical protein
MKNPENKNYKNYTMEHTLIMDERMKVRLGIACFVPVVSFLLCLVYYLYLVIPGPHPELAQTNIVSITSANYSTLFMILAISAIMEAPVFIYCLMLIARMKTMNQANKTIWIIFLSVFSPVASVMFWFMLVKDAPKYVPVYAEVG